MSDCVALLYKRAPAAPAGQSVGASPSTYTNSSVGIQMMTVTGGIVTLIEIDAGAGFLPAVGVAGVYVLMPAQSLRITYAVSAPTLTMVQL